MKYYLVGIKGTGMSALAKLLYDKGHTVLGVDVSEEFYTERNLKDIKMETFDNMILKEDYIYIIGNAYTNHSVANYIKRMNYINYSYPEFINIFFENYRFIAVSGSHGKTTTTKMLSSIIDDSSYIIGDGSGCGCGNSNFILEACEYRNTFLNYHPKISLVLNVDYDHPDFFITKEDYNAAFINFINQSEVVVLNGDIDLEVNADNIITYGLKENNDVIFSYISNGSTTEIKILDSIFTIPLVGEHYAYDFVGAYLVSKLLDINDDVIRNKIKDFKLPKRRMEKKKIFGVDAILDYAHHPTEIKSVYKTLREVYGDRKIVCCFQPHTISRTKAFLNEFKKSLSLFDEVYLLPIFSSVRENNNQFLEMKMYDFLGFKIIKNVKDITFINDNIYVFLGAGDIDKLLEE